MPISQKLRDMIRSAWNDGYPCLLATAGPNGPNISPKGSMIVCDDERGEACLAYWERSKKQALQNLGHDKRVAVMYANFKAQRDGALESGFLRFYGTAELHESGPVREYIDKRIPGRRPGTVDEIARLVAGIFAEDIPFLTGDTIYIDGGQGIAH